MEYEIGRACMFRENYTARLSTVLSIGIDRYTIT